MKKLTADEVLRNTFKHLDHVLDEKSRQVKQVTDESHTVAHFTKNSEHTRKKERDERGRPVNK